MQSPSVGTLERALAKDILSTTGAERSSWPEVSIVIPTYGREGILVDTIRHILEIKTESVEIIVVDQTPSHGGRVKHFLENLSRQGMVRWIKQKTPSITQAMNRGAEHALGKYLLFIDDDIEPESGLIMSHVDAHLSASGDLIAGRVLQPWHSDDECHDTFTESMGQLVDEFIGCNFSVPKELLVSVGGFDEQFKGAAYRYEREFADRLLEAGHRIWYEPTALIRHLHHSSGGTRSKGGHLTSWNPRHPVGAYYYFLVSPRVKGRAVKMLQRLGGSVATRHHLKAPWYIPVTLVSELLGLAWALWLCLKGPALPFARTPRPLPPA